MEEFDEKDEVKRMKSLRKIGEFGQDGVYFANGYRGKNLGNYG